MPDADGPPVSDNPPFIDYGGQFLADAEILQTVAETLLKLGKGDLGENVEEIAKRLTNVWPDSMFGLVDPILHSFATHVKTDEKIEKSIVVATNATNRYLLIRDVMAKWRHFVSHQPMTSILMVDRNRLLQWISDLHSGVYVNCVYCGHRYGPYGERPAQAVLTEHVENCPQHPLAAAKKRITELEQQLHRKNTNGNN